MKLVKFLLKVIGSLLGVVVLAIGGLNVAKFAIYAEYYSIAESLCINPGLNDGFVCQGIAAWDKEDKIVVSGYMKDKSASRLYIVDPQDNTYNYYEILTADGQPFTGHCGGIAVHGVVAIIASGGCLLTFPLTQDLSDGFGYIKNTFEVPVAASFIYSDDQHLYVGEFHDGNKYVTEHYYKTKEGEHYAIILRYNLQTFLKGDYEKMVPEVAYSIRDKVQGACFTPDGQIVLSTSYGLADTIYYVYKEEDLTYSGETFMSTPVMFLEDCYKEVRGPAMGEDLDYYNGKVITLTESASDKYIFGKLFFANKITSLSF